MPNSRDPYYCVMPRDGVDNINLLVQLQPFVDKTLLSVDALIQHEQDTICLNPEDVIFLKDIVAQLRELNYRIGANTGI